jgi:hypothetical protein
MISIEFVQKRQRRTASLGQQFSFGQWKYIRLFVIIISNFITSVPLILKEDSGEKLTLSVYLFY